VKAILLKYAARSLGAVLSACFLVALILLGWRGALGFLVGGLLSGASFLGFVYLVSDLLSPTAPAKSKAGLALLMFGKLALVGGVLWLAIAVLGVDGLGLMGGIAAAIFGFTLGLQRATRSPEGQAAMDAEEQRIAADLSKKG
jgi:hypothetical protein